MKNQNRLFFRKRNLAMLLAAALAAGTLTGCGVTKSDLGSGAESPDSGMTDNAVNGIENAVNSTENATDDTDSMTNSAENVGGAVPSADAAAASEGLDSSAETADAAPAYEKEAERSTAI